MNTVETSEHDLIININEVFMKTDAGGTKYKSQVWDLRLQEENIVACMTPEGPSDDFSFSVWLTNLQTKNSYVLKTIIMGKMVSKDYWINEKEGLLETVQFYKRGRCVGEDLIERIKEKGVVDLNRWKLVAPL